MGIRLNVLKGSEGGVSREDLVRRARNVEVELAGAVGQVEEVGAGVAVWSEEFRRVPPVNFLAQVRLAEGVTAAEAFAEVEGFYAGHGATCYSWQPEGSAGEASFDLLAAHFSALGWRRVVHRFYGLQKLVPLEGRGDLTVIPVRASFEKCRELLEASMAAEGRGDSEARGQMAEAFVRQFDDTRVDGLLALEGTEAVGVVRIFSQGEFGYVAGMVVHPGWIRKRVGATLMMGICEVAARSRLRHVTLCVWPDNGAAVGLYERMGFVALGERAAWRRP